MGKGAARLAAIIAQAAGRVKRLKTHFCVAASAQRSACPSRTGRGRTGRWQLLDDLWAMAHLHDMPVYETRVNEEERAGRLRPGTVPAVPAVVVVN